MDELNFPIVILFALLAELELINKNLMDAKNQHQFFCSQLFHSFIYYYYFFFLFVCEYIECFMLVIHS